MLRSNREEKFELAEPPHDTELTLGPAMLIGIACGLILLCGLCFGLGYSAGRHGSTPNASALTETATGQTVTAQPGSNLAKPPAKGTTPVPAVSQVEAAEKPQPVATEDTPAETPPSSNLQTAQANSSANPSPAVVKLTLPSIAMAQPVKATTTAQPAPGAGTMVQIAAVSHSEDADVLMNALRKRGYTVTARHLPGDNLIHVQIGPFANRSDANAMSQKLLSDGYNAVLMP